MSKFWPAWALVGVLAVLAVWLIPGHAFDDDEFQHLHLAWLIGGGTTPYVDVWEHHLVALHALAALPARWCDGISALYLGRVFGALMMALSVAMWWRVLRHREYSMGATAGALALMVLVPMYALKFHEVRPATAATALHAVAAWLIVVRGSDHNGAAGRRSVVWAGLAIGGMILCSQKMIYAAAGLFVAQWLIRGWRSAFAMTLVSAACGVGYVLAMLGLGALDAMIEQVVITNMGWRRSFSPAGYFGELYQTAGPFLALAVVGLVAGRVDRQHMAVGAMLLGAMLLVVVLPVPFRQAWLPLFGPLAWFAAWTWDRLRVAVPNWQLAVLVMACALPSVLGLWRQMEHAPTEDLARMRRVAALAGDGRPVFDGRGLLFWHPHVGHHACMHEGIQLMIDVDAYAAETIAALEAAHYPPVIMDYRVKAMPNAITAFIADHYLPHAEDEQVLLPGLRVSRTRLRGQGVLVEVPIAGTWRITYTGGGLQVDDQAVTSGDRLELEQGSYRVRARGFVSDVEMVVEQYRE